MIPHVLPALLALASYGFDDRYAMTPVNDSSCRPPIDAGSQPYCASLASVAGIRDPCTRSQAFTHHLDAVLIEFCESWRLQSDALEEVISAQDAKEKEAQAEIDRTVLFMIESVRVTVLVKTAVIGLDLMVSLLCQFPWALVARWARRAFG